MNRRKYMLSAACFTPSSFEKCEEKGHKLVSRWTEKIQIFDKDFLLAPINLSTHWSLIVIVRPGIMVVSVRTYD
jgi:Ulp1 family protease